MNIPYAQYQTFSLEGKQAVVTKMNALYAVLMQSGVQNPIFTYYDPVVQLISLTQTLDTIIDNGVQDTTADSICSRIVYLTQH